MEEQKTENNVNDGQIQAADNATAPNNVASAGTVEQPLQTVAENISQVKYAGFWIRWVAVLIDGIVVSFLTIPVLIIFYFLSGGFFSETKGEAPLGINFLSYAIGWGYYIFMTDKYQATFGKKLMGIMVTDENFKKAPLGKIILRETVGKVISGIILLIGYIMAAFSPKKKALHDIIAGTVVVYNPNSKNSKGVIVGVIIAVILFAIVILGLLASIVLVSLNSARQKAQERANEAREKSIEIQHQIENISEVE